MLKQPSKKNVPQKEVDELVDLCNAWLCVLLRRLGEGEHRFSIQEFKEGLGRLSLSIRREDGDYILSLHQPAEEKEGRHDGNEN